MISEEEKMAAVKMFCAYCKRTLRNARTDIIRKQAREARWETVFSDMHESELNRLASPDDLISEELGCPRSTVQFRRSKALLALRARLEEVIGDDEL